jgi:hypothetical protein
MPEINTISNDRMESFIEIIVSQARDAMQERSAAPNAGWLHKIIEMIRHFIR